MNGTRCVDEFLNEIGQPVLPGFEIPLTFKPRHGSGEGQTSSKSDEWYTHPEIVELTRTLFGGTIDLDPFSCPKANETVKATTYYTAEIDGLTRPWAGNLLFNPPWGSADKTAVKRRGVKKLLDSFHKGDLKAAICVLNSNATTTSWFAPLLDFPICIPPRRIEHYGPDGEGGSPNSGTIIIYVGVDVRRFATVFGSLGQIMVPYRTKVCSRCKDRKSVYGFGKNRSRSDGLSDYCKDCAKIVNKDRYWRYREKYASLQRERGKKTRRAFPERNLRNRCLERAKRKSIPCTITEEDIQIPSECPICGKPISLRQAESPVYQENYPSVDRYDPALGYVPGNVWVICVDCNRKKQDMTGEGLVEFGQRLIEAWRARDGAL